MNLLLAMNLPYLAYNGTSRSNRALGEALAAKQHSICVVAPALPTPSSITLEEYIHGLRAQGLEVQQQAEAVVFQLNGVEVHAVSNPNRIRAHWIDQIHRLNPDWVLMSSEDPSQSLLEAALKARPGRVVYLAHTPQMLPFGPASLYPGEARTHLVRQTAAVVTISRFVADYVEQWAGIPAFINHPPHYGAGPFPNVGRFDEGCVLLMNASAMKGISIFLALARAFPRVRFGTLLGYGTTSADREALAALPNVTLLKNSPNIDDIFRQARILLMPSLWEEGFGMAAVEAMLRGIPVLASRLGGLIEAKLGTDYLLPVQPITSYENQFGENWIPIPVVPEQEAGSWAEALGKLLSDRSTFEQLSSASRAAALKFVSELSTAPFEELLTRLALEPISPAARSNSNAISSPELPAGDPWLQKLAKLGPEQKALLIRRLHKKAS
jgi:glycosyltransferase involved in cell wall biosynthesis